MATLKTRPGLVRVADYLAGIDDSWRLRDCRSLMRIMREETGKRALMWGDSLVGFGRYSYKNARGQSFEWPITGLASRKRSLTVYIMPGFNDYGALLEKLGPHKTARSCLYLQHLDLLDLDVLRRLIRRSVHDMRSRYHCR